MNYEESKQILKEVKNAKKILLNCHKNPDPDSIGSALAMKMVLEKLGKEVEIISSSKELSEGVSFLKGYEMIQKDVDFSKVDFLKYDLMILLDSSSWDRACGSKTFPKPNIRTISIDHHFSNERYGDINLNDRIGATGEVLFNLFEDWNLSIKKDIAEALLTAIISDTGSFQYSYTTKRSFIIASKLIEIGADRDAIVKGLYFSYNLGYVRIFGKLLNNIKIDKENRFVWTSVPYEEVSKYPKSHSVKSSVASQFIRSIRGTDFGVVMTEREKNILSVSFRSQGEVDVSKLAQELGGSGHKEASGTILENCRYKEGVERVLNVCKKYARKSRKKDKKRN